MFHYQSLCPYHFCHVILARFAEWLSEERKTRLSQEPPPDPVQLAPPPVVQETPSPPPEAADPAPADQGKGQDQGAGDPAPAAAEEAPKQDEEAPAAVEQANVADNVAAPAADETPDAPERPEGLGEDAPESKKEEKAYVTFPYVPRAAYFEDPSNLRRVDSSFVPYSDPAYRSTYSAPNPFDYSNSYNSSYNSSYNDTPSRNSYGSSSYETPNRAPSYMPSPFEDAAYQTTAYNSYEPSFSTSYSESRYETPYSSSYSRQEESDHESSYGNSSYPADPRYENPSTYMTSYAPDTSVSASAYERPTYESMSTSYSATPEPTQYASYGDVHSSSYSTSYRESEWSGGAGGSRAYPDLFGFFP
jgi:hypothetical protein